MGFIHGSLLFSGSRFQVKLIQTAIFVKKKVKKKIFFAWLFQKKYMFLIINNL